MKCLFICSSLDIGGTETYLLRLVSYIAEHKQCESHVLCKSGRLGTLEESYRSMGVTLIPMRLGYLNPRSWWRLNRLIESERYDSICDLTGNFAGIPLRIAHNSGCEIRISFYRHSREFFRPLCLRNLYCRFVNRLVWWHATAVLSNSQAAFENFFSSAEWKGNNRFSVIPNGISWNPVPLSPMRAAQLRKELDLPSGCRVIGHVSRYLPQKNHCAILDAAESFQARGQEVIFLMVGRGVREHLQGEVNRRTLRNVRFAGERRDVPDLLRIMDAFYYPSITEGQPNALLEAVATGVPFVSSDIPEIRACFPSWWGRKWLVHPGDVSSACCILEKQISKSDEIFTEFPMLVSWLRENNSQEKRFEEFWAWLCPTGASGETH